MNQKIRSDLEYFVDNNKEFGYLKAISKMSSANYEKLVDYTLDAYNYYVDLGVHKRECKVQALYLGTKYCKNKGENYEKKSQT